MKDICTLRFNNSPCRHLVSIIYYMHIFPFIAFEETIFYIMPIFIRIEFPRISKKKTWWRRRAILSFAYAIRYESRCTRSSRQTTTTNCVQGQGSSLTLPLFDPPWKKVCNDPSWHKAIFFVASHLHPLYTRKWHALAMQGIKGAYNRSAYNHGEGTHPSILHAAYR